MHSKLCESVAFKARVCRTFKASTYKDHFLITEYRHVFCEVPLVPTHPHGGMAQGEVSFENGWHFKNQELTTLD